MAGERSRKQGSETALSDTKRELDVARQALAEPGSGSIANLECRLADLQVRFISTPAKSLADIEARLQAIRDIVATLGREGYLLQLVDATLHDVAAMQAAELAQAANKPD